MSYIQSFRRYETKYLITEEQAERLLHLAGDLLTPDRYGDYTICNLYLDTEDFYFIQRSLDKPKYKEKLRLRSYGNADGEQQVFLEIKKKFKGVVYKRRVSMTLKQAEEYLSQGTRPEDSQIMREIDYAMRLYRHPTPRMLIAYERDAYFVKGLPHLRLTFDSNLRYRSDDLLLEDGTEGKPILPEGRYILEVKTDGAMPIWLSHALDKFRILPSSFSKYGTAYREVTSAEGSTDKKGKHEYALSV